MDLPEAVTIRGLAAAQRIADPSDEAKQKQEHHRNRQRRADGAGARATAIADSTSGRTTPTAAAARLGTPKFPAQPNESPRGRGACQPQRRRRRPRELFVVRVGRWTFGAEDYPNGLAVGGAGRPGRLLSADAQIHRRGRAAPNRLRGVRCRRAGLLELARGPGSGRATDAARVATVSIGGRERAAGHSSRGGRDILDLSRDPAELSDGAGAQALTRCPRGAAERARGAQFPRQDVHPRRGRCPRRARDHFPRAELLGEDHADCRDGAGGRDVPLGRIRSPR